MLCPFKQNKKITVDTPIDAYNRGNYEEVEFGQCDKESCAIYDDNNARCGFKATNMRWFDANN